MADFLHVVLLPQAGDLLDWGGSGGQKIDTGGSVSLRRTILLKDFNDSVPQNASSHLDDPEGRTVGDQGEGNNLGELLADLDGGDEFKEGGKDEGEGT